MMINNQIEIKNIFTGKQKSVNNSIHQKNIINLNELDYIKDLPFPVLN